MSMMLKSVCDVPFLRILFIFIFTLSCVHVSRTELAEGNGTHTASACYGNVNNYLRLDCEDNTVIKVIKVFQGAKLKSSKCVTPATTETYKKMCCQPEKSDCKFKVNDVIGVRCNGHPNCHHIAMWSLAGNQCDQDIYPYTITYMQAYYTCVPLPSASEAPPTTATITTMTYEKTSVTNQTTVITSPTIATTSTTNLSLTSVILSVVSQDGEGNIDESSSSPEDTTESIAMSDAIIVAVSAGTLGMFLTLIIFIFYWRRKRLLRINGKPQATVWDYLLNQTFTVRGERGYDHFSSCRSSASSDGDPKSPVIRKNLWLPNISPMEDTQSDVFNDSDTNHKLEFHQLGTSNPYAFLTLGVNSNPSGPQNEV